MTVEILPLEAGRVGDAFDLATRVFVTGSTLHRALSIGLEEYRAYLRKSFEAMAGEGLSVVAVDAESGAVGGCLIASDFYHHVNGSGAVPEKFAPLAALTGALCAQYRADTEIVPGEVVLADMAAVTPELSGQGVYGLMRAAAQQGAKSKGFQRITGELSSTATQHLVMDKLGHSKRAEIAFERFAFDGRYPFRAIKQPHSIVLAEGGL